MVKSPCKLVCELEKDVCIGCKRTKEEISKWSKYTDKKKQKIINRIINTNLNTDYYGYPSY